MNNKRHLFIPKILLVLLSGLILGNIMVITSFWPRIFLKFEQVYETMGLDRTGLE